MVKRHPDFADSGIISPTAFFHYDSFQNYYPDGQPAFTQAELEAQDAFYRSRESQLAQEVLPFLPEYCRVVPKRNFAQKPLGLEVAGRLAQVEGALLHILDPFSWEIPQRTPAARRTLAFLKMRGWLLPENLSRKIAFIGAGDHLSEADAAGIKIGPPSDLDAFISSVQEILAFSLSHSEPEADTSLIIPQIKAVRKLVPLHFGDSSPSRIWTVDPDKDFWENLTENLRRPIPHPPFLPLLLTAGEFIESARRQNLQFNLMAFLRTEPRIWSQRMGALAERMQQAYRRINPPPFSCDQTSLDQTYLAVCQQELPTVKEQTEQMVRAILPLLSPGGQLLVSIGLGVPDKTQVELALRQYLLQILFQTMQEFQMTPKMINCWEENAPPFMSFFEIADIGVVIGTNTVNTQRFLRRSARLNT